MKVYITLIDKDYKSGVDKVFIDQEKAIEYVLSILTQEVYPNKFVSKEELRNWAISLITEKEVNFL